MDNEVKEPSPRNNFSTTHQYLQAERNASQKHKYYQGEVSAMIGTATNPVLSIEILSTPSTDYDMRKKNLPYRDIRSLKEDILVDSEEVFVQKYLKQDDGSWLLRFSKNISNLLSLTSVNIQLMHSDIHEGMSLK